MRYSDLITPLVKAVQQQNETIEKLVASRRSDHGEIEALQKRLERLEALIASRGR